MRRTLHHFHAAVLALAVCCLTYTPATAKRSRRPVLTDRLTAFFKRQLQKQEEAISHGRAVFINYAWDYDAMPADRPLRTKDIDDVSKTVWKAWCMANTQISQPGTTGLPTLHPLAEAAPADWALPQTLEPNATMSYYWGKKGDQGDSLHTSLPLFLYLHGSGPRDSEWAAGKRLSERFDDTPSLYFIPRIPNEGEYYRWWQVSKQYAWERLLRLALCYPQTDANRIYVFGISEGGYGSQRLASFYADYWAAAGPMAGGEPLRNAPPENCANIGFSLLTGERDRGFYRNLLTERAKEAFDSLQKTVNARLATDSLFTHRIALQKGMGHGINYSLDTPWLKTFRRNPWPKHVMWEDYAMDGRHRRAFYNISVEKRPATDDDARTAYSMDIAGDTIFMSISNVNYTVVERDPTWGIELKTTKQYHQASGGRIKLFLNRHLADLNRPIVLVINGKVRYEGKPNISTANLVESCLLWYDPYRLFPAAVTVDY